MDPFAQTWSISIIAGTNMTNAKFAKLFGGPPRKFERKLLKREK